MQKVSVILPVYNVEKYIGAALQSVLNQTYQALEILIVDDGSTDQSMAICETFADPRIRIIHQENKGLAEARNTGIRQTTGAYLAFLDGDDIWLPEKIERHVAHLNRATTVGISFSRSAFIDETGTPLNTYQMPRLTGITPDYMLRCNPVGNGSAGVFRREAFEAVGFPSAAGMRAYFDKAFTMSQDVECWLRILIQTPWGIEGIAEPLTQYRLSSGAISANLETRIIFWEKMFQKVNTYAPQLIEKSGDKAMAYRLRDLARESIRRQNPALARKLIHQAIPRYPRMLREDARSTLTVVIATYLFSLLPHALYGSIEHKIKQIAGKSQQRQMSKERFS